MQEDRKEIQTYL